jgi:hypothetical protein
VARGIPAHAPAHRLATRARTGGDTLASHRSPGRCHPSLSGVKIADQDVEMHAGCGTIAIPGSLEGKPLTVRRRFQRHPARIPLHRRPAEQPSPERCQVPRIRSVQHNLAYPPDHRIVAAAHGSIITGLTAPQRVDPVIRVRRMAGLHNFGIRAIDEQSLPVTRGPVTDPCCLVPGGHEVYRGCLGVPR